VADAVTGSLIGTDLQAGLLLATDCLKYWRSAIGYDRSPRPKGRLALFTGVSGTYQDAGLDSALKTANTASLQIGQSGCGHCVWSLVPFCGVQLW